MNALEKNEVTAAWESLGAVIPKPEAILMISAHWETEGTKILASAKPKTIHDFSGFPEALFSVNYPAPGDVSLSKSIAKELGISTSADWGLDHGAWSVLLHLFPKADIPVIPLSLDRSKSPAEHLAFAKKLASLRKRNIMILASGNIVHNLRAIQRRSDAATYPWAEHFDQFVTEALEKRDFAALANYEKCASCAAELSVPTAEHYLPLLYAAGASLPEDKITFPITGFQNASISMRAVKFA